MGNEADIHTIHFEGQVPTLRNFRQLGEVSPVLPATMQTLDFSANSQNSGRFLFFCHSEKHLYDGMAGFMNVTGNLNQEPNQNNDIRTIYIAAQEVLWDYVIQLVKTDQKIILFV